MRLVTWNLHNRNPDVNRVAVWLRDYRPDIAFLQELHEDHLSFLFGISGYNFCYAEDFIEGLQTT